MGAGLLLWLDAEEKCNGGIMDNRTKISEVLNSPEFSESDKSVVKWQFHIQGDFLNALWEAIIRADEDNLERLSRGFPIQVEGFKAWYSGDLAYRLRQTGLLI
jgi:hypothetical protein